MICNSYGIDDIQRQAVDLSPLLCYKKIKAVNAERTLKDKLVLEQKFALSHCLKS